MLEVGDKAPQLELVDTDRKKVRLTDFRGKKVVLAFYPGAFTGTCTKEMCSIRDMMGKFESLDAKVIGISVDSPFANKAFAEANQLRFPLLSDYTREAARAYAGVHEDFLGLEGYTVAKRAVFVIDPNGYVAFTWVSDDPGVEPPYEEIEAALSRL